MAEKHLPDFYTSEEIEPATIQKRRSAEDWKQGIAFVNINLSLSRC